jgi:hypothetical protein
MIPRFADAQTYWNLVSNPAGIGAELTWNAIILLVAFGVVVLWRRHQVRKAREAEHLLEVRKVNGQWGVYDNLDRIDGPFESEGEAFQARWRAS